MDIGSLPALHEWVSSISREFKHVILYEHDSHQVELVGCHIHIALSQDICCITPGITSQTVNAKEKKMANETAGCAGEADELDCESSISRMEAEVSLQCSQGHGCSHANITAW